MTAERYTRAGPRPASPETASLVATGLSKRFGGVQAVRDMGITLHRGHIHGVIGPNGSGKTTFFNLLAGLYRSPGGSIRLNGREIGRLRTQQRARHGLVRTFQESMAFPGLTVDDNIRMSRRIAGPRAARDFDVLSYVGLDAPPTRYAKELSWGQLRLLGIALALCAGPAVLLLDEPFAGLSPVSAEHVGELLRRLCADGYAISVVDHELEHLLPLCSQLTVMVRGRTLATGTPTEVIARDDVASAYLGI